LTTNGVPCMLLLKTNLCSITHEEYLLESLSAGCCETQVGTTHHRGAVPVDECTSRK
jgi:hypothetical protein